MSLTWRTSHTLISVKEINQYFGLETKIEGNSFLFRLNTQPHEKSYKKKK